MLWIPGPLRQGSSLLDTLECPQTPWLCWAQLMQLLSVAPQSWNHKLVALPAWVSGAAKHYGSTGHCPTGHLVLVTVSALGHMSVAPAYPILQNLGGGSHAFLALLGRSPPPTSLSRGHLTYWIQAMASLLKLRKQSSLPLNCLWGTSLNLKEYCIFLAK